MEGQLHYWRLQPREKMSHIRSILAMASLVSCQATFAQSSEVSIQTPPPPKYVGRFLKPFHLERRARWRR